MQEGNIIWEKIDFPDEDASDETCDKDDTIYYKIGNHVKKVLTEQHDSHSSTLLSYPVVYFHTWINGEGALECYIGETIDLIRRTEEHEKAGEDFSSWQSSWKAGKDRKSYFFSSKKMNKSMSLDLEDCLIRFITKSLENKAIYKITCNGRNNEQGSYSNKNERNDLLKSIWGVIQSNVFVFNSDEMKECFNIDKFIELQNTGEYDSTNQSDGTLSNNNFLFFCGYKDFDEIRFGIEKSSFEYKEWPVVYMHIWNDDEGLHIYTGEANKICQRTEEHINEAKKQFEKIENARERAREEFKKANNQDEIDKEKMKQAIEDSDFVKNAIADADWHLKWGEAIKKGKACMLIIGHEQFNKSITLDLENMLYEYTDKLDYLPDHTTKISVENGRGNEQRRYDNERYLSSFFNSVVEYLANDNEKETIYEWLKSQLINDFKFSHVQEMKDNAIFIASPINKLSPEQSKAKKDILEKIEENSNTKRLLIIQGGWGTGKTVVASSLFFDLYRDEKNVYFVMNHDQLMNVYKDQAVARAIGEKNKKAPDGIVGRIIKAETAKNMELDIVIVDEGHLLHEKNNFNVGKQLGKILKVARTVVLLYDPDQHVDYKSMYDDKEKEFASDDDLVGHFRKQLENDSIYNIEIQVVANLTQQFRMDCSDETIDWLKSLTKESEVINFPFNSKTTKYEFSHEYDYNTILEYDKDGRMVFEIHIVGSLDQLDELILKKKEKYTSTCLLSTYNYSYDENKDVTGLFLKNNEGIYHGWHMTGNGGVWFKDKIYKKTSKYFLAKARPKDCGICKSEKTPYYEVGSVHDIQGFDLDYAGVIIGESWKYEDGKIVTDLSKVAGDNHQDNGNKKIEKNKKRAISNELGVLLSRGKKGLVIYAVNEVLRNKLLEVTTKK